MALSDLLAPSLQASSTILSAGGQYASGRAARTVGSMRKAEADWEAMQLEQDASQSLGVGMRAAQDETLKALYANSKALAMAAASGAGASDPTVMALIARTAGEGTYRAQTAMYEGEAQARMDRLKAAGLRFQGDIALQGGAFADEQARRGAASTLLNGGLKTLSLFDKYWAGPTPDKTDATVPKTSSGTPASASSGSWLDAGSEIVDSA